jgi:two-component system, cell cycle sensor histidine kinase and response regulator CckA
MQAGVVRRVCIPLRDDDRIGPKTVLLVTSDANLRGAAARALETAGFRVLAVAHSGHAMLTALTAARIDVLASDLAMDDVSGPALAARLRRHHPGLQTLFFANSGTPQCDGVVVRPFTRDELLHGLAAIGS